MEKIKEVNMQIFITNKTRKNLRCKLQLNLLNKRKKLFVTYRTITQFKDWIV